jgi:hypothetical protein
MFSSLRRPSTGVLVLPGLHLCLCLAVALEILPRSEWSNWFVVFLVDFPISILFLMMQGVPPILSFGILGTAWWYLLGAIVSGVIRAVALRSRKGREGGLKSGAAQQ